MYEGFTNKVGHSTFFLNKRGCPFYCFQTAKNVFVELSASFQSSPAGVVGSVAEFGFDAQKLIIFGYAVRAGGGAVLIGRY
jgi:hypothetical protein